MNNFQYKYVPCNIWEILILKNYSFIYIKFMFTWGPVFYLATLPPGDIQQYLETFSVLKWIRRIAGI